MNSAGSFTGRVAVVTGASSGIGKSIAGALKAEGAAVHCLSRHPPHKNQKRKGSLFWHTVDVANDTSVAEFSQHFPDKSPGLDFLVHCAGIIRTGGVATTDVHDFDQQWKVNARAPYILTRALIPALIRRKGQIAFMNSSVWTHPRPNLSGYIASKYALKAFADVLRAEVNPLGVRVISLFPGRTATPMQEGIYRKNHPSYEPENLLQPAAIASSLLAAFALPPTAEVTDIFIRPAQQSSRGKDDQGKRDGGSASLRPEWA